MLHIYNHLKTQGDLDPSGEGINFLHWKYYPMDDEQKQAREHMDSALKLIEGYNPLLSEFSIYQSLLFDLTQKALWFPDEFPNIESQYKTVIDQLLNYTAIREIRIPIINLQVSSKPVKFGLVTFFKIGKLDKKGKWWDSMKAAAGEDQGKIYSYAQIKCRGDYEKSLDHAINITSETLGILRAIGFPMDFRINWQFGLINEYKLFQTRPFQVELIEESLDLKFNPQIVNRIGLGLASCNLQKDILNSAKRSHIKKLQSLIESDLNDPGSEIRKKFFLGLHWLGEATKPDTNEARFAKLAFALEALIGGDAGDKKGNLTTRGLTATLAERGAFIAGSNLTERQEIHEQVYDFYDIRSSIVHGGNKAITDDQISNFALLIRKIAWALLSRIDDFKSLTDLQKWVVKQRYS